MRVIEAGIEHVLGRYIFLLMMNSTEIRTGALTQEMNTIDRAAETLAMSDDNKLAREI